MDTVQVRRVANGFIITTTSGRIPATLFAATIPEVIFFLNKVFEPFA
jgi:hypothetical protein